MLTGRRLFQDETASDTLEAVFRQDVEPTGVPHVDSKFVIEAYLMSRPSGSVPSTLLRPGTFMDNIGQPFFPVKRGEVQGFTDGDAKLPYIACPFFAPRSLPFATAVLLCIGCGGASGDDRDAATGPADMAQPVGTPEAGMPPAAAGLPNPVDVPHARHGQPQRPPRHRARLRLTTRRHRAVRRHATGPRLGRDQRHLGMGHQRGNPAMLHELLRARGRRRQQ